MNRAARTDAGVHAAGNVVSIKMITSIPGVPNVLSRINELLPPEIRLWNFVRLDLLGEALFTPSAVLVLNFVTLDSGAKLVQRKDVGASNIAEVAVH